jgi:hypothetical protein
VSAHVDPTSLRGPEKIPTSAKMTAAIAGNGALVRAAISRR